MDIDPTTTAVIGGGSVEYSLAEAATPIQELIDLLESAKSEGAEHVVLSSGNYRGAQWAKLGDMYGWADEE